MDTLYLSGLGSLQILLNGRSVQVRRRKTAAVFIYLAVERQPQSREHLSGLLWPEYDQSKAFAYLRRALWEIKEVLGDGWLEAGREWIGLQSLASVHTDISQFQGLITKVKLHHGPLEVPCDQCIALLEKAINLYRGEFLSGFSLKDCPHFEDWQFLQSEIMRRMYRDSLQKLVNALETGGRVSEAVPYSQRWLATDNLDETAHRKLMTLLAKTGLIQEALRQFEQCRSILRKELNLAPETETTDLYNQILKSRSAAPSGKTRDERILVIERDQTSWIEQILASPVQIAFPSNLPVPTTPFFGRESEIREIASSLDTPNCWLLTLTGMGGIGKTRLAIQAAKSLRDAFPDGVYFVPLEGITASSILVSRVADTLGISFQLQEGTLMSQLTAFLRNKTMLIIFDNFDTLTAEGLILHQLFGEASSVKFLVTSRERLNISGEMVFEIQGLIYPELDAMNLDEIRQSSAVQLFVQGACRSVRNFQIDEENCLDIAATTRFFEGMPLGLEMAAAWIHLLTPGEILAEIRADLGFLKAEMRDSPERHSSMRAVLDYSWRRLDRNGQSALARLSVFQRGFTREAAEKAAGVSLLDIKKCRDRSFIHQKDPGRYQCTNSCANTHSKNYASSPRTSKMQTIGMRPITVWL